MIKTPAAIRFLALCRDLGLTLEIRDGTIYILPQDRARELLTPADLQLGREHKDAILWAFTDSGHARLEKRFRESAANALTAEFQGVHLAWQDALCRDLTLHDLALKLVTDVREARSATMQEVA